MSGAVSVVASASDNNAVVRVDVRLDGALLGSATAAPYQVAWNTAQSANGGHSLQAIAYDAAGNAGASLAIAVDVYNPPAPPPPEIVIHAARTAVFAGAWRLEPDTAAASGARLWHPNAGAPKLIAPLAAPVDYFEITFHAEAGVPYRLWMRAIAESNYWGNDSVFVQFSGSVTASGGDAHRIGTTAAFPYVLEDCSGCGVSGWGWQDNGYGSGVLGPLVYFAQTGSQTIRVQGREDGISIDQIVLSPSLYLTTAPGAVRNDATILPETSGPPPPAPPPPPVITVSMSDDLRTVLDRVAPGTIVQLPAGAVYGPLTIRRSVTLQGQGVRFVAPTNQSALVIESGDVTLVGVELTGNANDLLLIKSGAGHTTIRTPTSTAIP